MKFDRITDVRDVPSGTEVTYITFTRRHVSVNSDTISTGLSLVTPLAGLASYILTHSVLYTGSLVVLLVVASWALPGRGKKDRVPDIREVITTKTYPYSSGMFLIYPAFGDNERYLAFVHEMTESMNRTADNIKEERILVWESEHRKLIAALHQERADAINSTRYDYGLASVLAMESIADDYKELEGYV